MQIKRKKLLKDNKPLGLVRRAWEFKPGPGSVSNIRNLKIDGASICSGALNFIRSLVKQAWVQQQIQVLELEDEAVNPDDLTIRRFYIIYRLRGRPPLGGGVPSSGDKPLKPHG